MLTKIFYNKKKQMNKSTKNNSGIFLLICLLFLMSCKKTTSTLPDPVIPVDGQVYALSTDVFPNPERGFVHTYPVYSEGAPLNAATLATLKAQNITMVLRFFYLENFKTTAINAAELQLIQNDLDKIRTAGLKAILRFGYTDDIAGTDASLAVVTQHLDQLKPIFELNKDVIAFVQAGFIGAYGEWYYSSNGLTTVANKTAVLNKLLAVLPSEIMVQVRTPLYKQTIFNTVIPVGSDIAYTAQNRARVGHHNDCFLTGGDDYGTYSNIPVEKQFISDEALYVPVGGETCPPSAGYSPTCTEARKEMLLLRWTYLNVDYYPATINAWRNSGCFDEFQTYLGYRLALVSAKLPDAGTVNGSVNIAVTITNKGYAPLYNKKISSLVFKNKTSGIFYSKQLLADVRVCKPSTSLSITETVNLNSIPAGDYDMFIRITDNAASLKDRSAYSIRLANTNTWTEDNNGMNDLKHTIKIQ